MAGTTSTADFTLQAENAALLVVDLQRGFCERPLAESLGQRETAHYWDRLESTVLPNAERLIAAA